MEVPIVDWHEVALGVLGVLGAIIGAGLSAVGSVVARHGEAIRRLEMDAAGCQQDRQSLHALVDGKASREVVTGVEQQVAALRTEIVGRLDRLEALVREALSGDRAT